MSKIVYMIAGEASGDTIGAGLIRALKIREPDIKIMGIGGPLMEAEGLKSLFPMKELSLMGLFEIAPKLLSILKRMRQTIDHVKKINPDYLVTIDAPDFSFRVQKAIKKAQIKTAQIHYVAPTVWAWRPKRAQKVAQFLDGMICLFDFEPPYFKKEGLKSIAAGHPMMESNLVTAKPAEILKSHQETKKIGVFFGSREGEINRHADSFVTALKNIKKQESQIEIIAPTLGHLKNKIEEILEPLDIPFTISTDTAQKYNMMKACDAAIAVSGTIGLELAVAGIPHVIGYKMNGLTYALAKRLVKVKYAHLANIIMDKAIIPEFIQTECNGDNLANATLKLLNNDQVRVAQTNAFNIVRDKLGAQKNPSHVATDFILSFKT